jgi:hypothetical protein
LREAGYVEVHAVESPPTSIVKWSGGRRRAGVRRLASDHCYPGTDVHAFATTLLHAAAPSCTLEPP